MPPSEPTFIEYRQSPVLKQVGRTGAHLMGARAAACWRCFAMEAACSMGSTLRRRPPAITVRTICTHAICISRFLKGLPCLLRLLQVQVLMNEL